MALTDKLTAIANAIRAKSGSTAKLSLTDMVTEIGKFWKASSPTAAASDVLSGKSFVNSSGTLTNGSMTNRGAVSQSLSINGSYTIPAGYHNGSGKVTQSITTKAAATYGAKTSAQTIAAGQYLSGVQTIAAVSQSGLSAENIISGKTVTISSNGSNLWRITGTASTGISKSQLLEALQYSNLGLTSNSTEAQILAALAARFPQEFYIVNKDNDIVPLEWVGDALGFVKDITKTTDGLQFHQYAYNGACFAYYTTPVDVTNYNELVCTVSRYSGLAPSSTYSGTYIGIDTSSTIGDANYPGNTTWTKRVQLNGTGDYTINVSDLTGSYYLKIAMINSNTSDGYLAFSKLYLH